MSVRSAFFVGMVLFGALSLGWHRGDSLCPAAKAEPPSPRTKTPLVEKDSPEVVGLLLERRDVLRKVRVALLDAYQVGRGTLDVLLEVSRQLLEAELAVAVKPAERLAAHQTYFDDMKGIAESNKEKYDAGREDSGNLSQSEAAHLTAEVWLLRAKNAEGKASAEKDSPEIQELLEKRRDALRTQAVVRMHIFQVGRGTLNVLLAALREQLEAERTVSSKPADPLAAYRAHLENTKRIDQICKEKYEAGREDIANYYEALAARLEAEVWLLRARNAEGQAPAGKDSPDIRALLKERRDVLRKQLQARMDAYRVGRGALSLLLDVSQQLLEAEYAVSDKPTDRLAACQAAFDLRKTIEQINKELFDAGRADVSNYFQAKAARLEAEVHLLRAKGKVSPPGK